MKCKIIFIFMVFFIVLSSFVSGQKVVVTRTDNISYELKTVDFNNDILSVDQPANMEFAEIWLPKKPNKGVFSAEILTRESPEMQWKEVKSYCKNNTIMITENTTKLICNKEDLLKLNCTEKTSVAILGVLNELSDDCYYDLILLNDSYYFKIEHFSDYYVNGTNYTRLIDCMVAQNKTVNKCIINTDGFNETFNQTYHTADTLIEIADWADNILLDFNNSQHHLGSMRTYGNSYNITFKNWHITTKQGFCNTRHFYLTSKNMTLYNINSTCTTDDDYFSGTERLNMTKCTFNRTTIHATNCDNCTIDQTSVRNADIRAAAPNGNGIFTMIGDSRQSSITNSTCIMGNNPWADTESCFYFNCYNCTFTSLYAKGKTRKGIYQKWYFSETRNSVIEDSTKGMEAGTCNNYARNNTINNASQEGIRWNQGAIGNAYRGGVHNNRIYDSGNASLLNKETYNISYSPELFGGNCYNTGKFIYDKGYGSSVLITTNGTDVSQEVNGTNNFSLWLCSVGAVRYTLLVEEPQNAGLCAGVCGGAGLNCDYFENNYLVNNGQYNNYTYNNNTICGTGANPAWLSWENNTRTITYHYPLLAYASFNNQINISGNIIQTDDWRTHFHDANITQTTIGVAGFQAKNVWLNHWRTGQPIFNGLNISLCVNGKGNFYEESQRPNSSDCGQATITNPSAGELVNGTNNTLNITWNAQDAIIPIMYSLYYSLDNTTWTHLANTNNTWFLWDYLDLDLINDTNNVTLLLIPTDFVVNGTNMGQGFLMSVADFKSGVMILFAIASLLLAFSLLVNNKALQLSFFSLMLWTLVIMTNYALALVRTLGGTNQMISVMSNLFIVMMTIAIAFMVLTIILFLEELFRMLKWRGKARWKEYI